MPQRFMKCTCGHGEWHEAEKSYARPVNKKCGACGKAYDLDLPKRVRVFSIGNKPWGDEGRSVMYAFDPSARQSIGATCPETAKAIAEDGTVVFENDSHQKRVYAEWEREKAVAEGTRSAEVAQNEQVALGVGGEPVPEPEEFETAAAGSEE